jgi:hypothetical protein
MSRNLKRRGKRLKVTSNRRTVLFNSVP